MPIIEVRAPITTGDAKLGEVRRLIKVALLHLDVPENHITVEFTPCLNPERLLITYFTRSVQDLLEGDNVNIHAKAVGQIVESMFDTAVECLVAVLPKETTGLYLTPK